MGKRVAFVSKLTKDQLYGLRSYRRASIFCISFIIFLSLWLRIAFNTSWHFNDVFVEVISLFFLLFMGILANIKNDFPIFNMRKFSFTKDFLYSLVLFFSLLFFFLIYKNITEPDFISYLARLSFHDLVTILVFLLPVFIFIIYLIYIGLRLIDKDRSKNKDKDKKQIVVYSEKVEKSLDCYKDVTIKIIFAIMCISIWIKVGFFSGVFFPNVVMEISVIFTIVTLFIVGNIDNKLNAFYNKYVYIDRYFVYSLILPYLLIVIYAIFSKDFRILVGMMGFVQVISFLVSMMPLFFVTSCLFYKGLQLPTRTKNIKRKTKEIVVNKTRDNVLVSLILSLIIISLLFYYSFSHIVKGYYLENILQVIILFIPLFVVIYLIVYSCIKEINK